jgi:hypothetical protein
MPKIEKGNWKTRSSWDAEVWGQTDDGLWWGNVNGKLEAWHENGEHYDENTSLDVVAFVDTQDRKHD